MPSYPATELLSLTRQLLTIKIRITHLPNSSHPHLLMNTNFGNFGHGIFVAVNTDELIHYCLQNLMGTIVNEEDKAEWCS